MQTALWVADLGQGDLRVPCHKLLTCESLRDGGCFRDSNISRFSTCRSIADLNAKIPVMGPSHFILCNKGEASGAVDSEIVFDNELNMIYFMCTF